MLIQSVKVYIHTHAYHIYFCSYMYIYEYRYGVAKLVTLNYTDACNIV